ncbi:UPF0481 protein At3g47200-like [Juglans regia]|uniref:UPF0481 protein At3g47200-like n=1 Tax=Juglans regia TaxID=51240 RepID=A0A6P9EIP5_JUGRE|nr:UPF0481 protein At3g47200-like [Juglans regia]
MTRKTLSTRIEEFEEKHVGLTRNVNECCMYRVHKQLRKVNKKAYKPVLLAIGPYNDQSKVGQGFMEEHKLQYLHQMLKITKVHVETYIATLKELEERPRNCYGEHIRHTPEEFVEMMVLDGCLIIELFHKYKTRDILEDPIFQMKWVLPRIAHDLLLFENQLPFFVLAKLFRKSESNNTHVVDIDEEKDEISVESSTSTDQVIQTRLNDLALIFFSCFLPCQWNVDASSHNSTEKINHLLSLAHEAFTPLLPLMVCQRLKLGFRFKNAEFEHLLGLIHATISISLLDIEIDHARERQEVGVKCKNPKIFKHLVGLICEAIIPLLAKMKNMRKAKKFKRLHDLTKIEHKNIHSATELEEAGIKFKKVEKSNVFSIKFNNGLMEISPLGIEDHTETYLQNLIAYEQYCHRHNDVNYVYNDVCFMDHLINTPKDVELLRRKGIIRNNLGDDEVISTMVNKLGHYVSISNNLYARTIMDVNMHCRRRRNVWMAKLRHDYFNNPWALVSFMGAVLLLALAITQTIFSIIH